MDQDYGAWRISRQEQYAQDIYLFTENVLSTYSPATINRTMLSPIGNVPEFKAQSRLFAFELQQSDLVLQTHTGRMAVLIVPSGVRVSRCYFCGALTEIQHGDNKGGYIRVADPTGVLVLHIRPQSRDIHDLLRTLTTPSLVSVIASVESDTHPGKSGYRLILETISPSDRASRDRWIIRTADLTLERLELLSRVLSGEQETEDIKKAVSHYQSTPRQLRVLAGMVEKALVQVPASRPETPEGSVTEEADSVVADKIMNIIRQYSGPRGISVQELAGIAVKTGISESALMETIRTLITEDELYQPSSGFVKIL